MTERPADAARPGPVVPDKGPVPDGAPSDDELAAALVGLYPFALSLTRDPEVAADLIQDAWLRAAGARRQWRGDAPLRGWLRRIIHNLAIDRARRSQREVLVEEVEDRWRDPDFSVDAALVAERSQTREEVEDALARLPFIYRAAVVLHDIEGWTASQIAELLDIGLPAAKQRLRRGRMMLVTALAEGDDRREALKGVPMHCWDARLHVSEYLDGDPDAETAQLLEVHLETCPTCPPLYAALRGVQAELGGLRDPDTVIPPDLAARLAHS